MVDKSFFQYFFEPKSLAIVGISRRTPSLGQLILDNVEASNFSGDIYLINPKADKIRGYQCNKSLEEIDDEIDLVMILTPVRFVYPTLEQAITKGVKAVTIVTAGFSEVSDEGKKLEAEIKQLVSPHELRIIGPNSMGTYSHEIHASFSPISITQGDVAYLSQSGSILVAYLEIAEPYDIGFSKFISLGNKLDINTNISLNYLLKDDKTRVINCYLESFSAPSEFREEVTPISEVKPIIMVKSGRTTAGARAASSHTGALAGENKLVNAVLKSSGVIRVDSLEEQSLITRFYRKYQRIGSEGVAIISSAGGPATLATDEVIEHGLEVANFSEETMKKLEDIVPVEGNHTNPIDLLAAAKEPDYENTIEVLLEDSAVSAIIVIIVHPVLIKTGSLLQSLEKYDNLDVPIIPCYLGPDHVNYQKRTEQIVTASTKEAIFMIKQAQWYSNWLMTRERQSDRSHLENLSLRESTDDVFGLLDQAGFSVPDSASVSSLTEARSFVDKIGYPIVMKLDSPQFSHKSDVGGVLVNISDDQSMVEAWNKLQDIYARASIDEDKRYVLIQPYYEKSVEISMGIIYDEMFGHFLMVGTGGTLIEILDDVQFYPSPISSYIASNMIEETKLGILLDGFRDLPSIDRDLVIDYLLKLDRLVQEVPSIRELDLNPVLYDPNNEELVVVDARISYENL